jgi:hypothetical protein
MLSSIRIIKEKRYHLPVSLRILEASVSLMGQLCIIMVPLCANCREHNGCLSSTGPKMLCITWLASCHTTLFPHSLPPILSQVCLFCSFLGGVGRQLTWLLIWDSVSLGGSSWPRICDLPAIDSQLLSLQSLNSLILSGLFQTRGLAHMQVSACT